MAKLPDFEALAIFAKVVELRSLCSGFQRTGAVQGHVSKAVSRLEQRLGARLFNRTSRRLALTDAGQKLAERAGKLLADGEAAESEALAQSATATRPRPARGAHDIRGADPLRRYCRNSSHLSGGLDRPSSERCHHRSDRRGF